MFRKMLGTFSMLPDLMRVRMKWEWGSNSVRTPSMGTHAADRGTAKSSFIGSCRQQARGIPTKSQPRQRCGKQGARPRTKARPPLSQDKRSELSSELLGGPWAQPPSPTQLSIVPSGLPHENLEMPLMTIKCSWQVMPGEHK